MSFLGWIVIGGLAGWLAAVVVKARERGCLLNVAVGVIGGLLGGLLFQLMGINIAGGTLWSFFVAFVGAVLFLLVLQAISGSRRRR